MTEAEWATVSSVFVYGTLMPGERNEGVARQGGTGQIGTVQTERATLLGAALFDLRPEAYPALFPVLVETEVEPGSAVHGWLYTYAPADWSAALPFLDDLEGLHLSPPLYRRAGVTVHTAGGPRPAWVYWYARADRRHLPGCLPVPSGRWETVPDRQRPDEQQRPEDGRQR